MFQSTFSNLTLRRTSESFVFSSFAYNKDTPVIYIVNNFFLKD